MRAEKASEGISIDAMQFRCVTMRDSFVEMNRVASSWFYLMDHNTMMTNLPHARETIRSFFIKMKEPWTQYVTRDLQNEGVQLDAVSTDDWQTIFDVFQIRAAKIKRHCIKLCLQLSRI
jgi:hypothetical protein